MSKSDLYSPIHLEYRHGTRFSTTDVPLLRDLRLRPGARGCSRPGTKEMNNTSSRNCNKSFNFQTEPATSLPLLPTP